MIDDPVPTDLVVADEEVRAGVASGRGVVTSCLVVAPREEDRAASREYVRYEVATRTGPSVVVEVYSAPSFRYEFVAASDVGVGFGATLTPREVGETAADLGRVVDEHPEPRVVSNATAGRLVEAVRRLSGEDLDDLEVGLGEVGAVGTVRLDRVLDAVRRLALRFVSERDAASLLVVLDAVAAGSPLEWAIRRAPSVGRTA